jgi:hypothetical protein
MPPAFLLCLFWREGLAICPGWPESQFFYFMFLILAEIAEAWHHTQIFPIEMSIANFSFVCLGWPRIQILTTSASHVAWDDTCVLPCSAIYWDVGLTNFLPTLALNCNTLISVSQVASFIGMNHHTPLHLRFW